jgi:prepilin-type processing-associated H-X9-DG protein
MKTHCSNNRATAMTLFEVLMVIATVVILAAMILPALITRPHINRSRINCVNNLKEVGLSFKLWEGDNNDKYPMTVSVTNGGAMELVATGNVAACFQVMSNELSTPKILLCREDDAHASATNFGAGFNNRNVSYFIGVNANETNAQMFLAGDDNFELRGISVKSGLREFPTNTPIVWSAARHKFAGNIGLVDGSVEQFSQVGLQKAFVETRVATNRLAIP